MKRAQAALLLIGMRGQDFSGADLPAEITNGSKHLAGCAVGALVASGLVDVVGRIKSPHASAKGRKLDLLRLSSQGKARSWLVANGYADALEPTQLEMAV